MLMRTFPCVCTGLTKFNRVWKGTFRANNRSLNFRAGRHPAFCSAGGGPLAASAGSPLHAPFGWRKHQRATDSGILYFLLPTGAHERITERNHTASPSSPVVLRWLQEQHGGATIRCLLLLSQTSICHPRASATVDEECSQRVDLLQQTRKVISAGGQCRVERCFQVARGDTSGQYVALKQSHCLWGYPVVIAITHRPVQRCTLITAQWISAVVQSTRFSGFSSVIQHH